MGYKMTEMQKDFGVAGPQKITVEWAQKLAAVLHKNQTDHSGHPYILHPARVAQNLLRIAPDADEETIMAAWLHDTMEDCGVTFDQLIEWGYSERCALMVERLTKPTDDERPYAQVIEDLIATGDRGAMLIKLADNMDNLHPQRTAELRAAQPEKAARLAARYEDSVRKLCEAAGLDAAVVFEAIRNAPPLNFDPQAPLDVSPALA